MNARVALVLCLLLLPLTAFSEVKEIKGKSASRLVYEDIGHGETTLVFIHCWSCNREYWKNQVGAFSRDYRLILLDLPGHGNSAAGKKRPVTVELMGAEVAHLIKKLKLKNVVLIGSSMGGPIALDVAHRLPKQIKGIVGVDNFQNVEFKYPQEMFDKLAAHLEKDYQTGIREFLPGMFPKEADPKLVSWTVEEAGTCDPNVCVPLIQNLPKTDMPALMKRAHVPIRNINAVPYSRHSQRTNVEVNRKYADFEVIEMTGVGHFPMLEKPQDFNVKLDQAIESVLRASKKN